MSISFNTKKYPYFLYLCSWINFSEIYKIIILCLFFRITPGLQICKILLECLIIIWLLPKPSFSFVLWKDIWPSNRSFIFMKNKVKVKSLSCVWLFVTPWTVACQAPSSMGFSRQELWSGWPFPCPGDLLKPGIEFGSPALQVDSLLYEPPGNPLWRYMVPYKDHISSKIVLSK